MIILYAANEPFGRTRQEMSINNAIEYALTPDAYGYEGQLEKLQVEVAKLREMMARLMECVYGDMSIRYNKAEQLKHILGYGFEVEES